MRFVLTEEQTEKAYKWWDAIKKRDNRDIFSYGAAGGGLSFIFTPTNLGVIAEAKEALSGETVNLTDFSDW